MASALEISYMGPSMNPTLKAGDVMHVAPYRGRGIRAGDVVVFHAPGDRKVVHRVVSVGPSGVKTRGDNNLDLDRGLLTPDQIIGRVLSVRRKKREIVIHGGARGILRASVLHSVRVADPVVSRLLRPTYHRLARSRVFERLVSRWLKTRVVAFKRSDGTEMQIVFVRWVVGRRMPGQTLWRVRRPFRLFVDEALLVDEAPGDFVDTVMKGTRR